MPLGVSSVQWDLRVPAGSNIQWQIQMWVTGGITPFPITGHTFQYIVRDAQGSSGNILVKLRSDVPGTPTPVGGGLLSITNTALLTAVNLALYPPATSPLAAPGTFYHALWMDYADPVNAANIFWGTFFTDPAVPSG